MKKTKKPASTKKPVPVVTKPVQTLKAFAGTYCHGFDNFAILRS